MAKKYLDETNEWSVPSSGSAALDEKAIFLAAHPVGTYWWTETETDPNDAYGGEWEQIKGRFVYALDSETVNSTGGAKTVTLTTAQMPSHTHTGPSHSHTMSHTHTLAHTHSVGAHSHGLNSHTHTLYHTHSLSAHTHLMKGTHESWYASKTFISGTNAYVFSHINTEPGSHARRTEGPSLDTTGSASSTTTSGATGSTEKSTAFNTGAASSTTTSAASATSTGTDGTGATGSAGSGSAHENMPPYIAAYCWKRTA